MKKQVYVATYYSGNFGSALQAYALQKKLKEFGVDSYIVTPPNANKSKYSYFERFKSFIKPEKNYTLLSKIRKKIEGNTYKKRNEKIKSFIVNKTNIIDYSDFVNRVTSDDRSNSICIAGSDQVWNIINGPIQEFYLFKDIVGVRKTSYAVSLGQQSFDENQLYYYKDALKEFEWISIRERRTCNILNDYLKTGNIRSDVDPTLLVSVDEWKEMVGKKIFNEPYIFVYMLRPDHKLIEMARRLSDKKKIIFIGQFDYHYNGVVSITDCGVEDFLSLIYYADYIITNSFHGTLFSLIFDKKFASVKISSTSSRVENLLEMVGLKSHLISEIEETEIANENYNYNEAIRKLNIYKIQSIEYLDMLLN